MVVMLVTVFANEGFKIFPQKENVSKNKVWTVKFNKKIDKSTVSDDSIKVQDSKGENVEVKTKIKGENEITVTPISNYKEGETYTLFVSDKVKATNGESLKQQIKMDFKIKPAPQPLESNFVYKDISVYDGIYFDDFVNQVMGALGYQGGVQTLIDKKIIDPLDFPKYHKQMIRKEAARVVWGLLKDKGLVKAQGLGYKDYRGNLKDIYMIVPEYQEETVSCYMTGIMGLTEDGKFRPYGFVSKEEQDYLLKQIKRVKDNGGVEIKKGITPKAMPDYPKPKKNKISDFSRIYPYVPVSYYENEIGTQMAYGKSYRTNNITINEMWPWTKDFYKQAQNFVKTYYTFAYDNLDEKKYIKDVYSDLEAYTDYKGRLKYFLPSATKGMIKYAEPGEKFIPIEDFIDLRISNFKKHKVVCQTEFITDSSLFYDGGGFTQKGQLRIIYYPETSKEYLDVLGLKAGVWYTVDSFIIESFTNKSTWDVFKYPVAYIIGDIISFENPLQAEGYQQFYKVMK
jgi:hypothetical protein